MSAAGFDASLPEPHATARREAYRRDEGDGPRMAGYAPPGGGRPSRLFRAGSAFRAGSPRTRRSTPSAGCGPTNA